MYNVQRKNYTQQYCIVFEDFACLVNCSSTCNKEMIAIWSKEYFHLYNWSLNFIKIVYLCINICYNIMLYSSSIPNEISF